MMRRKLFQILLFLLIFPLFVSGCASPYLLMKQKNTIELQPNEGVVLFSARFNNKERVDQKNIFWTTSVTLQEVNQYKAYGAKRVLLIPSPGQNYIRQDDLFLFSLKLPRGTYKITSLDGLFRSLFSDQTFVGVNKLFDVVPGRISYAGRLEIDFSCGLSIHETRVEDKFGEDDGRFKNGYPALQNRSIVKDLIY